MNNQKGVTLVSLVVTIIVLIILAGISINLILGDNGIITVAKKAKENIELAKIEEEKELNELYTQLDSEDSDLDNLPYDSIAKLTEFKKAIANAIGEAGGIKPDISAETAVFTNNIKGIVKEVTKDATATENDIAEGKTAWVNGELITGIARNINNLEVTDTGTFKAGQTITLGYKPRALITVGVWSGDKTIRFCYYNESVSDSTFIWISGTKYTEDSPLGTNGNGIRTINDDGFTYGAGSNGTVSGSYIAYK